jgi:hypothetical protein
VWKTARPEHRWSECTVTVPNETDRATRKAAVYRLFAADGALLYIGSSYDPDKRCEVHHRLPWWREVGRRTEEWFPNRSQAYTAETKAIWREKPKYNVACTAEYNARRSDEAKAQAPLYRRRARAATLKNYARSATHRSFLSLWKPGTSPTPVLDAIRELEETHARAESDPSWVPRRYVARAEDAAAAMVNALVGLTWFDRPAVYSKLHQQLARDLAAEGATEEERAVVMGVATRLVGDRIDLVAD